MAVVITKVGQNNGGGSSWNWGNYDAAVSAGDIVLVFLMSNIARASGSPVPTTVNDSNDGPMTTLTSGTLFTDHATKDITLSVYTRTLTSGYAASDLFGNPSGGTFAGLGRSWLNLVYKVSGGVNTGLLGPTVRPPTDDPWPVSIDVGEFVAVATLDQFGGNDPDWSNNLMSGGGGGLPSLQVFYNTTSQVDIAPNVFGGSALFFGLAYGTSVVIDTDPASILYKKRHVTVHDLPHYLNTGMTREV